MMTITRAENDLYAHPPEVTPDHYFTRRELELLKSLEKEAMTWGSRNYGGGEDNPRWQELIKRAQADVEMQEEAFRGLLQ